VFTFNVVDISVMVYRSIHSICSFVFVLNNGLSDYNFSFKYMVQCMVIVINYVANLEWLFEADIDISLLYNLDI